MNIIQPVLVAVGVLALLAIGYAMLSGPNAAKASQRRLEQLRYRHSESTDAKVESQLKKAIAARGVGWRPAPLARKTVAGSMAGMSAGGARLLRCTRFER